jgi:[amino group carrier protein]-lysine/ornithine hydrolase
MTGNKIDSVDLLHNLLQCYSPSGEEAKAAASLATSMEQAGFVTNHDHAGNVIGSLGEGPKEIVLLGHIDTVKGFIEPVIEGDRLFGRGAVDAKGPLACFTCAAAQVGPRPGWKITVIGAVGEEADSRGAKHLCWVYPAPDLVMIGEPSGWDSITIGYKGGIWGTYSVVKSNTHTASSSMNACEAAVAFWNRVSAVTGAYNQTRERIFDQINPTLVSMQSQEDGYNQQAMLRFNVRIPTGLTPAEAADMLRAEVREGQIHLDEGLPAYKGDKNNPLVRHLLASIRKHGGKPGFKLKTGTSDMNVVGPVWNCPIIAYGPGDSNLDHTPEEHISLVEYEKSIAVLADALSAITSTGD